MDKMNQKMIKVLSGPLRSGGVTSSMSWETLADLIANQPLTPVRTGEAIVQFEVDSTGISFIMDKVI